MDTSGVPPPRTLTETRSGASARTKVSSDPGLGAAVLGEGWPGLGGWPRTHISGSSFLQDTACSLWPPMSLATRWV